MILKNDAGRTYLYRSRWVPKGPGVPHGYSTQEYVGAVGADVESLPETLAAVLTQEECQQLEDRLFRLYLAVVLDLWSRMVIGWSMGQRIDTRLVLDALTMALWRRRPKQQVLVHSDQGCQFTGHEWQTFLRDHNLLSSMSRRGNCHDNAVAESFFQLLKRERIKRRIYDTRQDARSDVFNYIELFYNPTRRHSTIAGMSPVEFEQRHSPRLVGV